MPPEFAGGEKGDPAKSPEEAKSRIAPSSVAKGKR
jgi:hypothetical protein